MEPWLKVNHIRVEWFDCMILALNSQNKGTDTPSQRCPVVDEERMRPMDVFHWF